MNRLTEMNDIQYLNKIIDAIDSNFGLWKEASPESNEKLKKHMEKLINYLVLEEQGLLIKLPCKVGDTVYFIYDESSGKKNYQKAIVEGIHIWSSGYVKINTHTDKRNKYWTGQEWLINAFGKAVFLTREEAEKALEGKEPKYLLEKDSICYGCQYYKLDEENNCVAPRLCIEGSLNDYSVEVEDGL